MEAINIENIKDWAITETKNYKYMMSVDYRREQLAKLKAQLKSNANILHLEGLFKLTKTERSHSEVYMLRDLELENGLESHLNTVANYDTIMRRYHAYDPSMHWQERPNHYAVRVLSGTGSFSCGKNIFAFFPEALGIMPRVADDVFGLEFIDVWENIFKQTVFPCMKKVFDIPTQIEVLDRLSSNLPRTIYMAAVFHEIGHRCGPWKVSPKPLPGVKLNGYHWGIMGEISTDTQLVLNLKEYKEIAYFVTLQRLFWFGRRGYGEDPLRGMTNVDNDSWLGSYLWNKLIAKGALKKTSATRWGLDFEKIIPTFEEIQKDIDALGYSLPTRNCTPDETVDEWMKTRTIWSPEIGFELPEEFRSMLSEVYDVPEKPIFFPPIELKQMKAEEKKSYEIMKKIIFIESSDIGVKYTAEATRLLGYSPLFLVNLSGVQGDTRTQFAEEHRKGSVIDCKTTDAKEMFNTLMQNGVKASEVLACLSFLDSRLLLVRELNQLLDTKMNIDPAIELLKSKEKVAELIKDFSPRSVSLSKNNYDLKQLERFLVEHSKVILKPSQLAGAIGAKTFENCTANELIAHIESLKLPTHLDNQIWVCQAFLHAPLYSAEGYVKDGRIHHLGISNRRKVGFSESQLSFPTNSELNIESETSYRSAIEALISRSQFKNGFFHIEFINVSNNCYIIDANVGRLGGGPLGELIPLSYQLDITQFFAFVISVSLGINNNIVNEISKVFESSYKDKSIGICYGSKEEGFLNKVKLPKGSSILHTQVLDDQQRVPKMGIDNWSWIGIVSALERDIEKISSNMKICINGKEENLCY